MPRQLRLLPAMILLLTVAFGASCSGNNPLSSTPTESSSFENAASPTAGPSTSTSAANALTPTLLPVLGSTPSAAAPLSSATITAQPAPTLNPNAKGVPVYLDGLGSTWQNWSWDTTVNLENPDPVHSGKTSLAVTHTKGWSALSLHTETLNASDYAGVRFWINGGPQGGQKIGFKVLDEGNGNTDNVVVVLPQVNAWTQVIVTLDQVGNPDTIGGLAWQEFTGAPANTYYLDDIELIPRQGPPPSTPTPSAGPGLSVDAQAGRHSISPYIYGMNYADETLAKELKLPVNRWGGNSATRYNWQIDVHNTGSDWYFENIPDQSVDPSKLPDGSTADQFIEQNLRTGTSTLLTIPMIGWTPKQRLSGHPYDCGFKVSKYGAQKSSDGYDQDCGNGVNANGQNVTGNDPTDTSKAIGPDFVQAWIKYLNGKYGSADLNGVRFYNLDNEPSLWFSVHRDVHPQKTTYDEVRDLTFKYAAALKAIDPAAQTLGPVEWGWCAYFYSAQEDCKLGLDHVTHLGVDFLDWYLQQMRQYEKDHGVRILDYLDLHFYPQGQGVYSGNRGNTQTQALRLRSTRALWDPSYSDESWIGKPVMLIPRMHAWVDKNYPGTKLSISEYNWGALGDINGALAEADVLGIFGREQLDLATLWDSPKGDDPGAFAFRVFRNYDGKGGAFGETSVNASSSDQDTLAIYAAQRSKDRALTIVVINKARTGQTSSLAVSNFNGSTAAQVFRYSAANLKAITRLPDLKLEGGALSTTYPASSITILVIPPA